MSVRADLSEKDVGWHLERNMLADIRHADLLFKCFGLCEDVRFNVIGHSPFTSAETTATGTWVTERLEQFISE